MEPDRKQEIERLFDQALDLPRDQRAGFLARECAGDGALLNEVSGLLAAHDRSFGILDVPTAAVRAAILEDRPAVVDPSDLEGPSLERVGPYRLVRRLGVGGMGSVYLGERDDQEFEQRVAVKVLRRGLDNEDLVGRFRAERQILASLQHPNIARLLDGGVTDDGLPYLIMEFVDGEPIDRYCDRLCLPIEDRLRLFTVVARAVQHAHRNLVVHRDLKPSNVLVTPEGRIKLLDFGIAKLLEAPSGMDAVPVTRTDFRFMTPEYASPEQVRGEPVTTAADVYGLGILLYELLTGHRPHRLQSESLSEMIRVVCTEEPARPSTVVGREESVGPPDDPVTVTPEAVARARTIRPERLRRKLRGDLDRIVAKALRKEPERRYPSAEQLAEDVDRYLGGRPVRARGDSVPYRMARFTARHRWSVAASAAFLAVLGTYAATLTVQNRRVQLALDQARLEATRSTELTELLLGMFENPEGDSPTSSEALRMVERGLARAEALDGRPEAQAQMLTALGRVYFHLGEYDRSEELYLRALDLRRRVLGEDHMNTATTLAALGSLYHGVARYDEALALLEEALAVQSAAVGPDNPRVAATRSELAKVKRDQGDLEGALELELEVHRTLSEQLEGDHPDLAQSLDRQGAILRRMGRMAEAEPAYVAALDMRRRLFSGDHPDLASSLNNVGLQYIQTGRADQAEPYFVESLGMFRRVFGDSHPDVAIVMTNLAGVHRDREEWDEARALYQKAYDIDRARFGPDSPRAASDLALMGSLALARGDLATAEERYRTVLEIRERSFGPRHVQVANALESLGRVYRDRGDLVLAEDFYRRALDMRRDLLGTHRATATSLHTMGLITRRQGRLEDAEAYYRQALDMRLELLGEESFSTAMTMNNLGVALRMMDRHDEAADILDRSRSAFTAARGPGDQWVAFVDRQIARNRMEAGDLEGAWEAAQRSLDLYTRVRRAGHPDIASTEHVLGQIARRQGDAPTAEAHFLRALDMRRAALGDGHADVRSTARQLVALYEEDGRAGAAEPYRALAGG